MDPKELFDNHIATGEPLTEEEVAAVVEAGLAEENDFANRGGNLFWHQPTFPEQED